MLFPKHKKKIPFLRLTVLNAGIKAYRQQGKAQKPAVNRKK